MLVGPKDLIKRAHRIRKMVGGGMRQAGVIAAGALYALRHNADRLADDHANAARLAKGFAERPGLTVRPSGTSDAALSAARGFFTARQQAAE